MPERLIFFIQLSLSESFAIFGVSFIVLGLSLVGRLIVRLPELIHGSRRRLEDTITELLRQGHELCLVAITALFAIGAVSGKSARAGETPVVLFVFFALLLFALYVIACVVSAFGHRPFRRGLFGADAWFVIHFPVVMGIISLAITYSLLLLVTGQVQYSARDWGSSVTGAAVVLTAVLIVWLLFVKAIDILILRSSARQAKPAPKTVTAKRVDHPIQRAGEELMILSEMVSNIATRHGWSQPSSGTMTELAGWFARLEHSAVRNAVADVELRRIRAAFAKVWQAAMAGQYILDLQSTDVNAKLAALYWLSENATLEDVQMLEEFRANERDGTLAELAAVAIDRAGRLSGP